MAYCPLCVICFCVCCVISTMLVQSICCHLIVRPFSVYGTCVVTFCDEVCTHPLWRHLYKTLCCCARMSHVTVS